MTPDKPPQVYQSDACSLLNVSRLYRGAPGEGASCHTEQSHPISGLTLVCLPGDVALIGQIKRDSPELSSDFTLDTHLAVHRTSFCFFLAAIPKRSHPFPSRTRKLSSSGPMVLQGQPCGRVGRCRGFEGSLERVGLLLFSALNLELEDSVQHATRLETRDRPQFSHSRSAR